MRHLQRRSRPKTLDRMLSLISDELANASAVPCHEEGWTGHRAIVVVTAQIRDERSEPIVCLLIESLEEPCPL